PVAPARQRSTAPRSGKNSRAKRGTWTPAQAKKQPPATLFASPKARQSTRGRPALPVSARGWDINHVEGGEKGAPRWPRSPNLAVGEVPQPCRVVMPHLTTDDGIRLFYQETGAGIPVVFVHEFAGDHRSYEPQLRYFGRRYRCIAYNARGYPPS